MNQVLDFVLQYKEFIVLGVALVGGVAFYGRKKVQQFVMAHLGSIEAEVMKGIAGNIPAYATKLYGMLPTSLKSFATINTIGKIIAKFLDK